MAIKLNVNRTQTINVPLEVADGKFEDFQVEMKILKSNEEDKKIGDLIVGISGLELSDESGRVLNEEATIKAVKEDTQLMGLISQAWVLGNQKSAKKQRTYLEQLEA